jgi:nardilysin
MEMKTSNDLEKANQGKVTGVIISPPEIEESIYLSGGVSDHKEYLYTTINGMKVLIISTKQLKLSGEDLVSAAALAVQTGSFNDPDEIQGLSHYLEHMIFMGSAKYPGENEYDAFVTSHGGSCNAFTEYEHTVYSFEIPQEYFFDALDIFANCFISPLLSSDSSDRELKAIESEFQLARTSDDARLEDMLCQLAHPSHLLHRFAWGNMESLKNEPLSRGIDVKSSLRQYFDRFYFPDNSQLVVTAPYSIQTILEGITSSFSAWQGSSSSLVSPLQVQFPFPSTPYLLRNVPIEQRTHSLKIIWTIPPTLSDYRSKSHEYLSHLIGHEGSGSILSRLKDLNLAYEITAGVSDIHSLSSRDILTSSRLAPVVSIPTPSSLSSLQPSSSLQEV